MFLFAGLNPCAFDGKAGVSIFYCGFVSRQKPVGGGFHCLIPFSAVTVGAKKECLLSANRLMAPLLQKASQSCLRPREKRYVSTFASVG